MVTGEYVGARLAQPLLEEFIRVNVSCEKKTIFLEDQTLDSSFPGWLYEQNIEFMAKLDFF